MKVDYTCVGCGKFVQGAELSLEDLEDGCYDGSLLCLECLEGLVTIDPEDPSQM